MGQGKEKILQTALEEFAEKGYDGARIDYISKMAGVNKALIYYHFKSKEELFTAVINDLFEQAVSVSIEPTGTSVRENLIQVVEHFIDFLMSYGAGKTVLAILLVLLWFGVLWPIIAFVNDIKFNRDTERRLHYLEEGRARLKGYQRMQES